MKDLRNGDASGDASGAGSSSADNRAALGCGLNNIRLAYYNDVGLDSFDSEGVDMYESEYLPDSEVPQVPDMFDFETEEERRILFIVIGVLGFCWE